MSDLPTLRQIVKLDLVRLNDVAGLDLESHAKELLEALNFYLQRCGDPKIAERVSNLRKIQRAAHEFCEILFNHSVAPQAALDDCIPQEMYPRLSIFARDLEEIERKANSQANGWKRSIRKRRGPKDSALFGFVLDVSEIYNKTGGTGIGCHWDGISDNYKGRLLDLTCELLHEAKKAGGPPFSRNTVALHLRKLGRAMKREQRLKVKVARKAIHAPSKVPSHAS